MKAKAKYELTFWGSIKLRYRRHHRSLESAREEAVRVLRRLALDNMAAAHPALIYGPDPKGRDDHVVSW